MKCPKCKEEIARLNNVQSGFMVWSMNIDGDYQGSASDFWADDNVNDWRCPMCDHIIAFGETTAISFLKGEKHE